MSVAGRGKNTRVRNWCWTLNNPTITAAVMRAHLEQHKNFRYSVFQLEKGESGTPHFQGYIEFNAPMRFNAVKTLIGGNPHLEGRNGTRDQARDYCMKEDSRLHGPWEAGSFTVGGQGARNDLLAIADEFKAGSRINKIANDYPDMYVRYHKGIEKLQVHLQPEVSNDIKVTLFYGPTGVGKTRTVMKMPDVFKKDGTNQWFDGYQGEDILLIDDFAGKKSGIYLSFILNVLDRYSCRLPVKGSMVLRRCSHIFVTTNIHPRLWYDYDKREEHYKALARRFTDVCWFPTIDNDEIMVTKKSFFFDWAEGCNESERFDKEESAHEEQSDSSECLFEPSDDEIEGTPDTQQYSPVYCVECNFVDNLCVCANNTPYNKINKAYTR